MTNIRISKNVVLKANDEHVIFTKIPFAHIKSLEQKKPHYEFYFYYNKPEINPFINIKKWLGPIDYLLTKNDIIINQDLNIVVINKNKTLNIICDESYSSFNVVEP